MTEARIHAILRYPVKGLSPELLGEAALSPGEGVPGDRVLAIMRGPSGFDPAKPAHLPKSAFYMLMKDERLAALTSRYEKDSDILTLARGSTGMAIRAPLSDAQCKERMEAFLAHYLEAAREDAPRLVRAEGHMFSDIPEKAVSIVNLASVADLAMKMQTPLNPLRFRANLFVEGWEPWREAELVGREIRIGAARLRVFKETKRCAATEVDPATALRDIDIVGALKTHFGRSVLGVYAKVTAPGAIKPGDAIEIDRAEDR